MTATAPGALGLDDVLGLAPVIPVVMIDDAADAVPLARALAAGGLPAIEITLRTPAALEAIARVAAEVEGAVVGAGTVTSREQVEQAVAAGARFLVSPGATPRLLDALEGAGTPYLPGVATASEVIAVLERGLSAAKLFPAERVGGVGLLKALAGPFAQMRFCPTGGITQALAGEYLALANVPCVGGSWMIPPRALSTRDWGHVQACARAAAELGERR